MLYRWNDDDDETINLLTKNMDTDRLFLIIVYPDELFMYCLLRLRFNPLWVTIINNLYYISFEERTKLSEWVQKTVKLIREEFSFFVL